MTILDDILKQKSLEVEQQKSLLSEQELYSLAASSTLPIGFAKTLMTSSKPRIIAEIKRASPSKGIICAELDPLQTAITYAENGAACISVLTDEKFFFGSLDSLRTIKQSFLLSSTKVPILRKDFIIDPYQIWQSRFYGADAILLIVAALSSEKLSALILESVKANCDILIEIHNHKELDTAFDIITKNLSHTKSIDIMLGVNARNLKTFVLDTAFAQQLIKDSCKMRDELKMQETLPIVAESGIRSTSDITLLHQSGADAFLIGESLLTNGEPAANLRKLM